MGAVHPQPVKLPGQKFEFGRRKSIIARMTEEVGLLQRMATRLSLRKVKKEQGVKEKVDGKEEKEEEEKEMKEESDVVKNGEQESVLHNDTKVGGKETANELPTNGGKVTVEKRVTGMKRRRRG